MDKQFWNVPLSPNPFFTGREDVLQQVYETLHSHQLAILNGLIGVGKTQIAVRYAYLHRQEYQAVLWILADTVESLNLGFIEIAQELDLPEKNLPNQEDIIKSVKQWLKKHNNWLLILDNINDMSLINLGMNDTYNLGENSHLLLTTRATMTEYFAQTVPVETMSFEEGKLFFLRRVFNTQKLDFDENDQATAGKIAQELDYLPLAIEQAGVYIRETQCSLTSYFQRYSNLASQKLATWNELTTQYNYPVAAVMTWTLSFREITYDNPEVADLLRLCAFLNPDKIPIEIFQVFDIEPIELDELLAAVFKCSLLHYNPKTKILTIPPLIQIILKEGMDESEQRIWAEMAVQAVGNAVPKPDSEINSSYERLLPCIQTCAVWVNKWGLTFGEADSPPKETHYYIDETVESTQPFLEQTSTSKTTTGKGHSNIIQNLNNIALLYYAQGEYDKAKPLYEQILALREKFLGKEHPVVAITLNHLADVYQAQEAYEQAKLLYERALAIREKAHGTEHPEVAQSLNNLARLYQAQEAYEQAKPLYERALQILNKIFAPDYQYVQWCSDNYADLLEKMKETKTN